MQDEIDLEIKDFINRRLGKFESFLGVQSGNSRVALMSISGNHYLLKRYLGDDNRSRKSCSRERYALRILQEYGVRNTPKLMEELSSEKINCMEYIKGSTPPSDISTVISIIEFQRTMIEVHLWLKEGGKDIPLAVDAAFSSEEIVTQVGQRLKGGAKESESDWKLVAQGLEHLKSSRIHHLDDKVTKIARVLSQKDIGRHNMLDGEDQRKYFIDFEFFGVDSPQKLIIDFLLHPQNTFDFSANEMFCSTLIDLYGLNVKSLTHWIPAISLKWATIMLRRMEILGKEGTEESRLSDSRQLFARYVELAGLSYSSGKDDLTQVLRLVIN